MTSSLTIDQSLMGQEIRKKGTKELFIVIGYGVATFSQMNPTRQVETPVLVCISECGELHNLPLQEVVVGPSSRKNITKFKFYGGTE